MVIYVVDDTQSSVQNQGHDKLQFVDLLNELIHLDGTISGLHVEAITEKRVEVAMERTIEGLKEVRRKNGIAVAIVLDLHWHLPVPGESNPDAKAFYGLDKIYRKMNMFWQGLIINPKEQDKKRPWRHVFVRTRLKDKQPEQVHQKALEYGIPEHHVLQTEYIAKRSGTHDPAALTILQAAKEYQSLIKGRREMAFECACLPTAPIVPVI